MQYQITKTYNCKKTTCGELVKQLKKSGGNIYCVMEPEFIDPLFPADIYPVIDSWSWIQDNSPKKVLYLVMEEESIGQLI